MHKMSGYYLKNEIQKPRFQFFTASGMTGFFWVFWLSKVLSLIPLGSVDISELVKVKFLPFVLYTEFAGDIILSVSYLPHVIIHHYCLTYLLLLILSLIQRRLFELLNTLWLSHIAVFCQSSWSKFLLWNCKVFLIF